MKSVISRFSTTTVNMVKAKVFRYVSAFDGLPKEENLRLEEFELPPLKDGGKLKSFEILRFVYRKDAKLNL